MYSVVLMMAMTTGAESPNCGHRHNCCGGYGGYSGCYGGCYGCGGGYYGGCNGYYGGSPYNAAPYGGVRPMPGPGTGTKPEELKKPPKPEAAIPTTGRFIVSLPADATLTVDGSPTTSTSSERVFVTPDLEPGRDFQYKLKAIVIRDGKPITAEKTVKVRAGVETRTTIDLSQFAGDR